jgi:hypothetical protein
MIDHCEMLVAPAGKGTVTTVLNCGLHAARAASKQMKGKPLRAGTVGFVGLLVAVFGCTVLAGPQRGYLATLGPVPLRFQASPLPPTVVCVLPPPAREVPVASAPVCLQQMSQPTNETVAVQSPAPVAPSTMPETTNEAIVTPQMLLEFFRQKAGHDTSVVLPLNFVPPQSSYRPSSTATYESP